MIPPVFEYSCSAIKARLEWSEKTIVSELTLSIWAGESLALIGETGSGKTMLAQAIMGLLPRNVTAHGETVTLMGEPLPRGKGMQKILGSRIVYIPQNGHESLDPSRTVGKQLFDSLKKNGVPKQQWESVAMEKLELAGLSNGGELLSKYPFQLSGGMAQRAVIAIAACADAELVIADEPTNGLDHAVRASFLELMSSLFPKAARLIITHDIAVAETCDDILVLCRGKMMECGPTHKVLSHPRHPYTKALIAAQVKNGMGESPVLRAGVGDCPFYRRCPMATDTCLSDRGHCSENGTEWWCAIANDTR